MKDAFYDWCIANNRSDLLDSWDKEKNSPLTPHDVAPKSNKKYWWHCSVCDNSWQAQLSNRVANGRNCPFCSGRQIKAGFNDLSTTRPDIASSWNYEKNAPITPQMVTRGNSTKKYWWVCSKCNNTWDSTIADRCAGNGCPFCVNKRIKAGFNDLATINPDLAKTWDYEKNSPVTPDQVPPHGAKKYWWICPKCGESWKVCINDRVKREGCPKCALKSISDKLSVPKEGKNLTASNPDLAQSWNYEKNAPVTPDQVSVGSSRKYWWKCQICGHEWEASVANRDKGRGCPCCGNEKRRVTLSAPEDGYSLLDVYPEVAKTWNYEKNAPVTPDQVTPKTMKKYWWKCETCGNSWQAAVASRTNGTGCSYCKGKSVKAGFNDFASAMPDIAKTWDYDKNKPVTPDQVAHHSNKKFWWLCPVCGHSWESTVNNRAYGYGCPKCMSTYQTSTLQKTIEYYFSQITECVSSYHADFLGRMEIDVFLPKLMIGIEYDGAKWHNTTIQNDLKKNRLCIDNGIKLIRIREIGLPELEGSLNYYVIKNDFSSLKQVIIQIAKDLSLPEIKFDPEKDRLYIYSLYHQSALERSLAFANPEVAKTWDYDKNYPLTPDRVPSYSNKKFWWICPQCNNSWESTAGHRVEGRGCPKCARNKSLITKSTPRKGESFAELYPKESNTWDFERNNPVTPYEIKPSNGKKYWWICPQCGGSWEVSPSNRLKRDCCLDCSYKKRIDKRYVIEPGQDLKSLYPEIADTWDYDKNYPLLPDKMFPHNGKKVWWICPDCGNSWATRVEHRVEGHGCPKCSHKKAWEKRRARMSMN